MAAPENMLKPALIKEVRELRQAVKLLNRQLEEKKDDSGEISGDIKAPVFYFDDKSRRFITAVANVNLNQLTEIKEHGVQRHMAEQRVLVYCEDVLYSQILGEDNE